MIKIEYAKVMNLEGAIRGARNPMNSWGRMDSAIRRKRQLHTWR